MTEGVPQHCEEPMLDMGVWPRANGYIRGWKCRCCGKLKTIYVRFEHETRETKPTSEDPGN